MIHLIDVGWAQLTGISAADWLAIITGVGYALLAVRRSRWCWLVGASSSLVLIYVAFRSALPMQGALQVFYVAMSIYGFWRWSQTGEARSFRITRWPLQWHVGWVLVCVVVSWSIGPWLSRYSAAAWPRLDTIVMLGSLLATWMTAQGKLENWAYWIVIDLASVYLYYVQAAVGAALLYALYVAIAVSGLVAWSAQYRTQSRP